MVHPKNDLWTFRKVIAKYRLKFSFTNIRGLRSNPVDCESFLESNSPDIPALFETNLDASIDSGNFSEEVSFL